MQMNNKGACTSDRMSTGGKIYDVVRSGYQFTYETTESGLKSGL